MDFVQASDPGSARRLREAVLVPAALIGVERAWRISAARISGKYDKSMGLGGSAAG